MTKATGPLKDITIIDCTMALAGPFGTSLLADMGANVIKVEPPGGDVSRSLAPLPPDYANPNASEPAGVDFGGYFASINRNKRSITLDLKNPTDRESLLELCDGADALVENMRVGVMDRLGVGYDVLSKRKPSLVYGAIRGFGDPRTGASPYANWPAYDIVAQSMGGLAHITGPQEGTGNPSGASVGDIYPGTLMALGLLAAVHSARATGEGQFFDVGMYDAVLALSETVVTNYSMAGKELGPRGAHHPSLMPFGIFPTSDGGISIAAPGPGHWAALCEAMGRSDLVDDERARNVHLRSRNQEFVEEIIAGWTKTLTKKQIMEAIGGKVPCGPVNTAADIFADPHVAARQMLTEFEMPGDNPPATIVGSPIKFTNTPSGFYRRAPMLNEHGAEIRSEFGLAAANDAGRTD